MNWHNWCSAMTVPESTPAPISTQSWMIFQIGASGHLIVLALAHHGSDCGVQIVFLCSCHLEDGDAGQLAAGGRGVVGWIIQKFPLHLSL